MIAIAEFALSVDGCLSRISLMQWDGELTKLGNAEGLSQYGSSEMCDYSLLNVITAS